MKELFAALAFMGFMISILGVFMFFVWRYIRRRVAKTADSWNTAAHQLGIEFVADAASKDPKLSGTVDGYDVIVGVTLDSVASARDVHRKLHRVGTKVEVATPSRLEFTLVPRKSKARARPDGWKSPKSGSVEFDDKFEVWMKEEAESLPTELCSALKGISIAIQVGEGRVLWWQNQVLKDPDRLEKTVRDCVTAARALDRHGQ